MCEYVIFRFAAECVCLFYIHFIYILSLVFKQFFLALCIQWKWVNSCTTSKVIDSETLIILMMSRAQRGVWGSNPD